MKKLFIIILLAATFFFTTQSVDARTTRVHGYFKHSGTYVQPYHRTSANHYKADNWSSKGNYNPYTGKKGYKSW